MSDQEQGNGGGGESTASGAGNPTPDPSMNGGGGKYDLLGVGTSTPAAADLDLETVDTSAPAAPEAPAVDVAVPPAPAAEEEDQDAPRPPSTTVQQDAHVYVPMEPGAWSDTDITLALAPDTQDRMEDAIAMSPNVALDDNQAGATWVQILQASRYTVPFKGYFNGTTYRDGSTWRQKVDSEKGGLGAATPVFKDQEGTKLTGERAALRVKALLGMGSIIQIPLWHSGFWVTLKAPSESEMLELNRRLIEEKVLLGRRTYGLAFANNSVFFAGWVLDLVIRNIYATSLKNSDNIQTKISSLDIPILAWGLACVLNPRGFQYARSVLTEGGKSNKVVREKLNVSKLLWVDTSSLTKWQITHMAQRHDFTMTGDSLERYRNEFTRGQGRSIKLHDKLTVNLRVPSMEQYLTSGQSWVNNVVAMVDKAFGLPPDDDVRNRYIFEQGKATNLRQYSHWAESLVTDSNQTIDDVETLDLTFDTLSADDTVTKAFFEGVKTFMEDSTIALIATPIVDESEKSDLPRFPHLLPMDALSTFFTLLVQKVRLIQAR